RPVTPHALAIASIDGSCALGACRDAARIGFLAVYWLTARLAMTFVLSEMILKLSDRIWLGVSWKLAEGICTGWGTSFPVICTLRAEKVPFIAGLSAAPVAWIFALAWPLTEVPGANATPKAEARRPAS